jgi:ribonuclease H2 subunit A
MDLPLAGFPDLQGPCLLGIDEAGRGPVLGPMVYACAFWPLEKEAELKKMNFDDSKVLDESVREKLFADIQKNNVGFLANVLSPKYISTSMLRICKYNLNDLSHDTAANLVEKVLEKGYQITHVYVDTVGDEKKYENKLSQRFPKISFKVSKKADSIYPIVSAASICAKVIRDSVLKNWTFEEPHFRESQESPKANPKSPQWGSGYPGDPLTKKWLRTNCDRVFGFPSVVRFSWKTAKNLLKEKAVSVNWGDDEEEEELPYKRRKLMNPESINNARQQSKSQNAIASWLSGDTPSQKQNHEDPDLSVKSEEKKTLKRRRSLSALDREAYFLERNLCTVEDI